MSASSTAQTLIERPAWKALEVHFRSVRNLHLRQIVLTWALRALRDEAAVRRHFVAVSTNAEGVSEFGIDTANTD